MRDAVAVNPTATDRLADDVPQLLEKNCGIGLSQATGNVGLTGFLLNIFLDAPLLAVGAAFGVYGAAWICLDLVRAFPWLVPVAVSLACVCLHFFWRMRRDGLLSMVPAVDAAFQQSFAALIREIADRVAIHASDLVRLALLVSCELNEEQDRDLLEEMSNSFRTTAFRRPALGLLPLAVQRVFLGERRWGKFEEELSERRKNRDSQEESDLSSLLKLIRASGRRPHVRRGFRLKGDPPISSVPLEESVRDRSSSTSSTGSSNQISSTAGIAAADWPIGESVEDEGSERWWEDNGIRDEQELPATGSWLPVVPHVVQAKTVVHGMNAVANGAATCAISALRLPWWLAKEAASGAAGLPFCLSGKLLELLDSILETPSMSADAGQNSLQ
eukprot:TRINITY_DN40842_c0_g1_i1.p1 TRINITY_DN40842_c0_g1~~TRINITY_DN40842_c0_g1_i1.p1  ORF type:complete len:388 (-),score=58.50 TRINITY_DN40842_c0_g1_i1:232-1395(-)